MPHRLLLDTGAANLIAVGNTAALAKLARASRVFIPEIVFGELYFGAYWYTYLHQSTKLLDLYDNYLQQYRHHLLRCNAETAHIYGAIYAELRSKGQSIQQNDVWIAALARQHHLVLITVEKDFERITGLNIELW